MVGGRIGGFYSLVTVRMAAHTLGGRNYDMANANLLAILVAAACGFLVGGIWYGPLFGKAWQREIGLSDDDLKSANMLKIYGTTFLFSVLSAVALGHLLVHFGEMSTRSTMMISTGIALGFIAPAIGTNYLFGRKSGKLFAIDAGYWVAFYAAMGLVFALIGV
jgi:hypothetical protein